MGMWFLPVTWANSVLPWMKSLVTPTFDRSWASAVKNASSNIRPKRGPLVWLVLFCQPGD
jgi:hypothetical protein